MKKYSYYAMAFAAMTLAACSSEEILDVPQTSQKAFSIKAYMNNGESRATATQEEDKHKFAWQADDEIGVYNGTEITKLTLSEGEGTNTGVFSAEEEVEGIQTAVYPYNEAHKYENNSWTITLPASYTYDGAYTGNVNCPMIANVLDSSNTSEEETSASLQFNHLAGAIRFDLLSLPTEANELVLTLPGKKIAGEFTVDGNEIKTSDSSDENEQSISIKFKQQAAAASEAEQSSVFFFPVPTGDYTSLKLEIKGANGVLNTYENDKNFSIAKNEMAMYPVISIGGEAEDLKEAFENGGTFTLAKDMTILDGANYVKKDLTIDLNGHTLKTSGTAGNKEIFAEECTLTIKDSSTDQTGTITVPVFAGDIKEKSGVFKTGSVVLESGSITNSGSGACIGIGKDGKFTMTGGKLINTGANFAIGSNNLSGSTENNSVITISGGELESAEDYTIFIADAQSLTISGDAKLKGKCGVVAIDKGTLNIEGGTFESECLGLADKSGNGTNGFPGAIIAAPCLYGNVNVSVSGGTFKGSTGISTAKGNRTAKGDFTTTVSVSGGTWEDPEVLNYATADSDISVVMAADKEIKRFINVTKGKATIDFNGYTITNKTQHIYNNDESSPFTGSQGFIITGSNTDITFKDSKGNGGIKIDASQLDGNLRRHALFIYLSAKVKIEGGNFYNTQKDNVSTDLIQVGAGKTSDAASLTITGGHFETSCYSIYGGKNPRYWVLNKKNDSTNCTISVSGGEFVNFNPAKPAMDDDESYLADGFTVSVDSSKTDAASKAYYELWEENETPEKITYKVVAQSSNE